MILHRVLEHAHEVHAERLLDECFLLAQRDELHQGQSIFCNARRGRFTPPRASPSLSLMLSG